jgi:lipopolysaccharide transport system permease protein
MTKGGSLPESCSYLAPNAKDKLDTHDSSLHNMEAALSKLEKGRGTAPIQPEKETAPLPVGGRPLITIRPSRGWVAINFSELWEFRDLLISLAGRDLRLRYKQTALGIAWVVLQPLMAAGVFSFVFGTVANLPSGDVPYLIFSFAGLLGWNLFNSIIAKTSSCMVGNSHLISKVYFPRLILPLSNIGSTLVDFLVAAGVMGLLMVVYRVAPSPMLLLLPLWVLILVAISVGIGLVAAALSVSYRDVQYIVPVFMQILLYASPVAYSVSAVPEHLRWIYLINPISAPLEAMRASLLNTAFPGWMPLLISAFVAALLLLGGCFAFKRFEKKFADVI